MAYTIATRFVDRLVTQGVKRLYGIVGDSLNPVTDAVHHHPQIEWIHVRHEETGAFAASAEAQLTGEIAVCAGSSGPGNMHLINGLYDAYRSHAKVLALASHIPLSQVGTYYMQETKPTWLFAECAKYVELISEPVQVDRILNMAIRTSMADSGVSAVVLSGDVASEKIEEKELQKITLCDSYPVPSEDTIKELAELLNSHEKVTFFCGIGCRHAREEVLQCAGLLKAPIGFTFKGKECMEYDNPYEVGMTGLLGWGDAFEAMHDCDVLVLLGMDFPYPAFIPNKGKKVIQIDKRADHLGRRTRLDMAICGDVGMTLKMLAPLLNNKESDLYLKRCKERHEVKVQALDKYVQTEHGKVRPEFLVSELSKHATQDAIFTIDTGTPDIWAARYLRAAAGRRFVSSYTHASMACALPMAIGAQCTCKDKQVIALCGDGGLSMVLGELITVRQYKLPIKIVVFNNNSLNFIRWEMEAAGYVPAFIGLDNPDFSLVAASMGIWSKRIYTSADLNNSLEAFLSHEGPALLDVVVDENAMALPPHISFDQAKGYSLSMIKQLLAGNVSQVWDTLDDNKEILLGSLRS